LSFFKKTLFLVLIVILFIQCGKEKKNNGSAKKSENTPPEITKIVLLPENPTVKTEITAQILSLDKEGDPITYKVVWFLNNKEIGEGTSLSYPKVNKGDKIFAEITPYDGKAWGKTVRSKEVIIKGSPPKILSIQIAPESLFVTTPQVVLTATAEDPDKDSVNLIVHWVVKDQVIPDTSNVLNLKNYNLKKNDIITGSAFVDDGEFKSEPFTFELKIANAPPVFTSEVDSIKCTPDSIYYKLPIIDPDGDAVTFELLNAPEGITIDKTTGIISGSVGEEVSSFQISIRATDSEGAYIEAQYTLTSPQIDINP